MFSTSILGSLLALAGVVKLAGGSIPFLLIDTIVVFVWAALSLFGLIWQNQSK
jgi:low affinity Fe/Cu permease